MKKKLLAVALTIFMALCLIACGNNKKDFEENDVEEAGVEEIETAAEEAEATGEEPVVVEVEYQLLRMDSAFHGGIAWAYIEDNANISRHVLINKDLQVVYELPDGMVAGDIFDGKAVVIHENQLSDSGFMILGADGSVLYECSDNLGDISEEYRDIYVNLTKDGSTVYRKIENGLTGLTYVCILNDKFETVAQMEIDKEKFQDFPIYPDTRYFYLSDGVYCATAPWGKLYYIINTKDNTIVMDEGFAESSTFGICWDMDRCVGVTTVIGYPYGSEYCIATEAENIDYSQITDAETLRNLIESQNKIKNDMAEDFIDHIDYIFKHNFINYVSNFDSGISYLEGFTLPDFGAELEGFGISTEGKYAMLCLKGADSKSYYTVINRDGQSLYDPVPSEHLSGFDVGVFGGYILGETGAGITPDGKEFKLGDGTVLSGIGEDFIGWSDSGDIMISDGYICMNDMLYRVDGTEVTTVKGIREAGADSAMNTEPGDEDADADFAW